MEDQLRRVEASRLETLRRVREEMAEELRRQAEELRSVNAAAQEERRQLLRQLQEANQALRAEIEETRRREENRSRAGREMAESAFRRASAQEEAVREMPHAFFCPGQFEIFQEQLESARRMLEKGMYDAAAATAAAAQTELELLAVNVQESRREWLEMYEVYSGVASGLYETMLRFEDSVIRTPYGEFRLEDGERDYWSRGTYREIREEILEAREIAERAGQAGSPAEGREAFVKGFRLAREIDGLHRLSARLTAAISCIQSERIYSDLRCRMAETAEEFLTEEGYQVERSRFRGEPREEPLDCYDLTVGLNGSDHIGLTFVPRREDGVAIGNVCVVTLDIRTIPDPRLIETRARDVIAGIRQAYPALPAVWYQGGDAQIAETERRYSQRPDVRLLARRLERKYQ